jgi:hypothetical protein
MNKSAMDDSVKIHYYLEMPYKIVDSNAMLLMVIKLNGICLIRLQ